MSTSPTLSTTQHPTMHTQVDGLSYRPERVSVIAALSHIRSARKSPKNVDAVNVYAFTGRDGIPLHVVYIHHTPGRWHGVKDVIDVYEIPTAALTDL
ncbi:hypothetical protein OHA84_19405 [Streptomyces sp. NBC_00513]|uniref:hypothetical protein n=1 Tax=unclassified Streptomyces TaxID=2593676 RepID=UPI0022535699|nr:hypothetical protein [Streptomyces sp. NBC_00424]MCX5074305.1 hypothetical protein [Streptomyces sp. NBC_00424]WUD42502.1 hypothetical protein OHA84_19405 [Streptomyces sp. NBC_00513]